MVGSFYSPGNMIVKSMVFKILVNKSTVILILN